MTEEIIKQMSQTIKEIGYKVDAYCEAVEIEVSKAKKVLINGSDYTEEQLKITIEEYANIKSD